MSCLVVDFLGLVFVDPLMSQLISVLVVLEGGCLQIFLKQLYSFVCLFVENKLKRFFFVLIADQ